MKKTTNIKLMSLLGTFAFSAVMLISSCTKENLNPGNGTAYVSSTENDKAVIKKANDFMNKIEKIKIVDENGKVTGTVNRSTGGFTFADGSEGFNFSSTSG